MTWWDDGICLYSCIRLPIKISKLTAFFLEENYLAQFCEHFWQNYHEWMIKVSAISQSLKWLVRMITMQTEITPKMSVVPSRTYTGVGCIQPTLQREVCSCNVAATHWVWKRYVYCDVITSAADAVNEFDREPFSEVLNELRSRCSLSMTELSQLHSSYPSGQRLASSSSAAPPSNSGLKLSQSRSGIVTLYKYVECLISHCWILVF